jgi:hypothetical protein
MKQLLFAFFLSLTAFAQSQEMLTTTLDMADVEMDRRTLLPFSAVQVMDVRFDRSHIGCISEIKKANASRIKHVQAKASFPDSLHHYLPLLLQKIAHFNVESKDTLVLLIKQFRISDRIYNSINRQFEPELLLRLSFSAYSKTENQLRRIYSIDDLLLEKIPDDRILKPEVMDGFRKELLMKMLQKVLESKNWQSTGAAFSFATVQEGIRKRYQLPLFTDSALRPGVYKTFQEFKRNAPSLVNVQFEMKKDRVIGVKDMEGAPVDLSNYWGVCSGKKHYIVFRNELRELHRSDKGFYFHSYVYRSELAGKPSFGDYAPQTGLLGAALLKVSENQAFDHWFFLNMDEETLYLEDVFGKSSLKQMQKELLK